jgi:probable rRNA maturation factor
LSGSLSIKSSQREIRVNARLLRKITNALLTEFIGIEDFDLAICIVRAPEMAKLNETFLQHEGSTDVITFDYAENPGRARRSARAVLNSTTSSGAHGVTLHGEIFICIDDAVSQARQFRTTWQSELVRYVIHGILHLRGFDDLRAADRRKMKRQENRLLKEVARLFPLSKLGRTPKLGV